LLVDWSGALQGAPDFSLFVVRRTLYACAAQNASLSVITASPANFSASIERAAASAWPAPQAAAPHARDEKAHPFQRRSSHSISVASIRGTVAIMR